MGSCNSGGKGASSSGGGSAWNKQGKAKTPEEALASTNPNFAKGKEYQINCQRCVYAYELQRQGYDVEALPHTMTQNDPMNGMSRWGQGFVGQQWDRNLGNRNTAVEQNIVSKMQQWGDGSRAVVYVTWKRGNSSHVFNIENQGGKVGIFDAQTGKQHKLSEYISNAKPSSTMISRVDNLKPNANVIQYAVKKKGSK